MKIAKQQIKKPNLKAIQYLSISACITSAQTTTRTTTKPTTTTA